MPTPPPRPAQTTPPDPSAIADHETAYEDCCPPDGMPALIHRLRCDSQRRAVAMTDWVAALTGHPAADFLAGRVHYADFIDPNDRDRVLHSLHLARQQSCSYTVEYRLRAADGQTRWVLENGCCRRDADGDWVSDGVVVDLSDRQRASDEQQSLLIAIATDPASIQGDLEVAIPRLTETAARAVKVDRLSIWLFEGDSQTLVLQDLYLLDEDEHYGEQTIDTTDFPVYFDAMHHSRSLAAHDVHQHPHTRELCDSYYDPLGITAALDAAIRLRGELAGCVCMEHIGGPRDWKANEIHFAAEIADQVAQILMHRDRQDADRERQDLQTQLFQAQKLEAVGRLAGGIAHDFNNLLTAISGASELLELSIDHPEPNVAGLLRDIQQTTRRASELTQGLLAFSRRHPTALQPLNINAQTRDMQRLMQHLLGPRMELVLCLQRDVPMVMANPNQFEQILSNLLVNARDAMPDGGRVVLGSSTQVVHDSQEALTGVISPGIYGVLTMADEGCGIPQDSLSEVFEPFFTTKSEQGGTGLGLSTVYGIVRQWGGHIRIDSKAGKGTTVAILIPATDAEASTDTQAPANDQLSSSGGNETILVVEDEPMVRRFCEQILNHLGYEVFSCENGQDATEFLESNQDVDLILSDMIMPQMDGIALGRWVSKNRPEIPVLFMTGYSATDTPTVEAFPHAGVIDKPFTTETLAKAVRRAIEHGVI